MKVRLDCWSTGSIAWRRWRLGFMIFYAFNPFVLLAWTVYAQDKTLLFFGIAALLLALERGREWAAWLAATALAAFKFLGAFAMPVLALHWFRRRRWWALLPVTAFVVVLVLSNLPWFPKSLDAFSRRDDLLAIDPPIHVAPTLLLARIGIYAPIEAKLLPVAATIVALVFYVIRRIDIREAMVWSLLAGYVFLPDTDFDRLLLITLPFFLILDLRCRRHGRQPRRPARALGDRRDAARRVLPRGDGAQCAVDEPPARARARLLPCRPARRAGSDRARRSLA